MRTLALFLMSLLAACSKLGSGPATLVEARNGFVTHATWVDPSAGPAPQPPPGVLALIKYPSPVGALCAYLTPDPKDGARHPAIVWITGGDNASIGDVWTPQPVDNDQTAGAFRQAGIVTLYPSLRGGNDNPGRREGFYGEVDDVLAAANYLAQQPYVDPNRIYLGGHSTGGTLVLLVGEYSTRFRDVFSFGPVGDVRQYGGDFVAPGVSDPTELRLRSPINWLSSIRSPVFVLEGDGAGSNETSLVQMRANNVDPQAHFVIIPGATHFSDLAPATAMIARKILADTGPTTAIAITDDDATALLRPATRP